MSPHQSSVEDVLRELSVTAAQGLSQEEARQRLERHGPNELIDPGVKSPWRILLEQLSSTLVLVLIAACILSAALGDVHDAIAILTIVVLNALLGLRQEYKAERAMAALKKLAVPHVRVRRGGEVIDIAAPELTVGDMVILEAGNAIPADGRLVDAASLRVQEAALTGESEPVEKDATLTLPADAPLGDRRNMVFLGTAATYGRGTMLVTGVGMQTELGHIAKMIQTAGDDATPLQKRLDHLGRRLAVVALALVALIFALGWWRGETEKEGGLRNLLLTSVSLAVAAVPEGLSAVVTIALALGAQRMLRRNALIRKLPAVETLGSVTVICSDKTGTLTKNQMTVTALDVEGQDVTVAETTNEVGEAQLRLTTEDEVELREHPSLALLLAGANLCNDAVVQHHPTPEDEHAIQVLGDPTEGALVLAGHQLGVDKQDWEKVLPRVDELPFDSERKRMSTAHRIARPSGDGGTLLDLLPGAATGEAEQILFTKGAFDGLLSISPHVWTRAGTQPLDDSHQQKIQAAHDRLAGEGMRVLGVAYRTLDSSVAKVDWESDLTFVGLIGMLDPPRPEAVDAIAECRSAGIRVMMITGDHPLTAKSIADKLGLDTSHGVVTGPDLDKTPDDQRPALVRERSIYARVSPEHKLRLVEALRVQGEVVAMTGDGVNDAPALKQADIGVAMGITGTDVSKEAADMVLRDDNFATIVAAVEEGRVIFDNVRKFIRYLLCTNAGEIWVMLLGPLAGMPLPLLPLQILWMNLATDGFPALALGVEPAEADIMQRPPRKTSDSIFAGGVGIDILWIGLLMAALALGVGYWSWSQDPSGPWQTLVFTTMTLSQLMHALAVRSEHSNFWQVNWLSNKSLLAAVGAMFLAQMAITYVPFLQPTFSTVSLTLPQLLLCLGLSSLVFVAVELEKGIIKLRRPHG